MKFDQVLSRSVLSYLPFLDMYAEEEERVNSQDDYAGHDSEPKASAPAVKPTIQTQSS